MYGYGHNSNYGYGYGGSAASGAPPGLPSVYGNYAGSANGAGYTQAPSSAYGYGTTATTFDHTYGANKGRMASNGPIGFTSAGTLSSTQAALSSLYPPQQSVAAAAVNALNANVPSGTHYEGYESAVLAVTTDFLHKTQGPNWVNGGPGTYPNGTFPSKKRPGFGHHQRPPADPGAYYCETCKVSCAGPKAYTEHLAGKNHKKREAIESGKNQINLPKNKITFRCDICELTCTGKDTYDAHVKGSRHQKTLNLLKKLGKPLPATEPTIIPPQNQKSESGNETENNSGASKPTKVIGVSGTQFVGGSTLTNSTTTSEQGKEAIEAALEAESQIQPLGEEYVDAKYDSNGKLLEFHCRLCDCSFSDPNAKSVHTKGRRHRLSYKNKVDSSIRVELKQSVVTARMKKERKIQKEVSKNFFNQQGPFQQGSFPHQWFDADNSLFYGNQESVDDRHILAKYEELKMEEGTLQDVNRLVEMVEKSLKATSDVFTPEFFKSPEEPTPTESKESEQPSERILKGLMKVGLYANGLLMKTDDVVDLVVLTSMPPTKWALLKVAELLNLHFDPAFKDKLNVSTDIESANFTVKVEGFPTIVKVALTCPVMREYEGNNAKPTEELPKDHLPLESCLRALAELRRAKWYQAKALPLEGMNVIMTILRDIRERVSTWEPLTTYMLSLFTQNVLESFGFPMTPGDGLRRVFEAISSCVLLNRRAVVTDPCEKEKTDVMEPLNRQQREDITSSAQHALRLIVFDQIEKILDMGRLQEKNDRKRTTDTSNDGMEVELKKSKSS